MIVVKKSSKELQYLRNCGHFLGVDYFAFPHCKYVNYWCNFFLHPYRYRIIEAICIFKRLQATVTKRLLASLDTICTFLNRFCSRNIWSSTISHTFEA